MLMYFYWEMEVNYYMEFWDNYLFDECWFLVFKWGIMGFKRCVINVNS